MPTIRREKETKNHEENDGDNNNNQITNIEWEIVWFEEDWKIQNIHTQTEKSGAINDASADSNGRAEEERRVDCLCAYDGWFFVLAVNMFSSLTKPRAKELSLKIMK